jgi:HEAT repeat protein
MALISVLARVVLLVTCCATPLRAQERDRDAAAGAQIDQRLAEWRAGKLASPEQLCDALFKIGRDASAPLCRLLDAPPPELPVAPVARAVARIGSTQCTPTLTHLAASPLAVNRAAAIEALGVLARIEALPLLTAALDDGDPEVCDKAEAALLTTTLARMRVALALSQRMDVAKDKCRPALVLARMGGDEAHEILLEHLTSWVESQCVAALQGVTLLSLPEDGPAVLHVLRDTTWVSARKEASLFLGRVKCEAAVRDLIEVIHDDDPGAATNAHWALQQITGLSLKNDADLWEFWWERTGKKIYGSHDEPQPDH